MKAPITASLVTSLRQKNARSEVWDTRLPNFFVQIHVSGKASYFVRIQTGPRQSRNHRLGNADTLTAAEARIAARQYLLSSLTGSKDIVEKSATTKTLEEIVDQYFMPHIMATKKSWNQDKVLLRCHILPIFGAKRLDAIKSSDISAWMVSLKQQKSLAPATCNHAFFVMNHLYRLAMDIWEIVQENPCRKVAPFRVHNQRQVYLREDQIESLLKLARNPENVPRVPHMYEILVLLIMTGVRMTNALHARWDQFDEQRRIWHIPNTKSGKPHDVWLSDAVIDMLKKLPTREISTWLFPNPMRRDGRPFDHVYFTWKHLCDRAGIRNTRLHDLRHTFASLLIQQGFSLYVVQHALGHHSPKMTMRYAHLADETLKRALDSVSQSLSFISSQSILSQEVTGSEGIT